MARLQIERLADFPDAAIRILVHQESPKPEVDIGFRGVVSQDGLELFESARGVKLHDRGHRITELKDHIPVGFGYLRRYPGPPEPSDAGGHDDLRRFMIDPG